MSIRVVRPSKIAPEIPSGVEFFLRAEMDRHQLALEGDSPESLDVQKRMEKELDEMDEEGFFDEETAWEIASATGTVYMVLRGMQDEIDRRAHREPSDTEQRAKARSASAYAALLRSGLEIRQWRQTWEDSPCAPMQWPSDEHAICSAVAAYVQNRLGDQQSVLQLADFLQPPTEDIAA